MKPVNSEQLLAVFQDTLCLIAPLLPQQPPSSKYRGLLSKSFAAKYPNTRIDIKNTDCLDECLFLRQQALGGACRIGLVSTLCEGGLGDLRSGLKETVTTTVLVCMAFGQAGVQPINSSCLTPPVLLWHQPHS